MAASARRTESTTFSKSGLAERASARSTRTGRIRARPHAGAPHWAGRCPGSPRDASNLRGSVDSPIPPIPWKTTTLSRGASKSAGSKAGLLTYRRCSASAATAKSHCPWRFVNASAVPSVRSFVRNSARRSRPATPAPQQRSSGRQLSSASTLLKKHPRRRLHPHQCVAHPRVIHSPSAVSHGCG